MVCVLDWHQKPVMPCSEKRARQLWERGRAGIHTLTPFTIRMQDRTARDSAVQPLRVKFGGLREFCPGVLSLNAFGPIPARTALTSDIIPSHVCLAAGHCLNWPY